MYVRTCRKVRTLPAHGAPTPDADGLNCMIRDVMREVEAPLSFQGAGINEIVFLNALDDMAANAFDDQCTGTNPRYPLVNELKKEILIQAYYGNVEEEKHHPVAA